MNTHRQNKTILNKLLTNKNKVIYLCHKLIGEIKLCSTDADTIGKYYQKQHLTVL
jgi:hypothetical protein